VDYGRARTSDARAPRTLVDLVDSLWTFALCWRPHGGVVVTLFGVVPVSCGHCHSCYRCACPLGLWRLLSFCVLLPFNYLACQVGPAGVQVGSAFSSPGPHATYSTTQIDLPPIREWDRRVQHTQNLCCTNDETNLAYQSHISNLKINTARLISKLVTDLYFNLEKQS
jgi:hypothetical protein